MDISSWDETWGTIDWKKDPEDKIKQRIVELYRAGVDFNMNGWYNSSGGKPVLYASEYSTTGVIDLLIDGGADINLPDQSANRDLALHGAACYNRVENVRFLIEHGPRNYVNKQNGFGWTALHVAAMGGRDRFKVAKALIELGADVNIKDKEGKTAWDMAGDKVKKLIENADKIRAEYLKKYPQGSLQETLNEASEKGMSLKSVFVGAFKNKKVK